MGILRNDKKDYRINTIIPAVPVCDAENLTFPGITDTMNNVIVWMNCKNHCKGESEHV
ncbi:hypothetical protein JCM17042A_04540 [Ruminococcus champanellensis 18P13 = JCM 17042]